MYQRSEHTYRRDDDNDRNEGGWRSWFGLGKNKDDDRDRDYHYARTTTYRNDDRDNYNRDNYNRDYNVTRTATYVRDDDRDRTSGFGGRMGSDYRGGYGYQTSGESNRGSGQTYGGYGMGQSSYGGAQSYGQSYDRDNRGWSSSINDRDRTYGNESSRYTTGGDGRYTTGGEASARGGYYSSSSTYDRPTGGDYSSSRTTYRGYGDNDRDNSRGYSYTSRSNW